MKLRILRDRVLEAIATPLKFALRATMSSVSDPQWVSRDGRVTRVSDMDDGWIKNAIALMERSGRGKDAIVTALRRERDGRRALHRQRNREKNEREAAVKAKKRAKWLERCRLREEREAAAAALSDPGPLSQRSSEITAPIETVVENCRVTMSTDPHASLVFYDAFKHALRETEIADIIAQDPTLTRSGAEFELDARAQLRAIHVEVVEADDNVVNVHAAITEIADRDGIVNVPAADFANIARRMDRHGQAAADVNVRAFFDAVKRPPAPEDFLPSDTGPHVISFAATAVDEKERACFFDALKSAPIIVVPFDAEITYHVGNVFVEHDMPDDHTAVLTAREIAAAHTLLENPSPDTVVINAIDVEKGVVDFNVGGVVHRYDSASVVDYDAVKHSIRVNGVKLHGAEAEIAIRNAEAWARVPKKAST